MRMSEVVWRCPACGYHDYILVIGDSDGMGSMSFRCSRCGRVDDGRGKSYVKTGYRLVMVPTDLRTLA
jgi:DNA-directed RNA polymerase subunit RPC12/RpoP